MRHACISPTMIPIDPAFEQIEQGAGSCPVGSREKEPAGEPTSPDQRPGFVWFRLPRLRRQKGLATGIIGLW